MSKLVRHLESLLACAAVVCILIATHVIVGLARLLRRPLDRADAPGTDSRPQRVMLVGTFYNNAWFDAHVAPLLACESIEHVTVVTDAPLRDMARVTYATPPRWLKRVCGRTGARAVWVIRAARRNGCNILIGYHIMPNALICLVAARLLGKRAVYQMTGGPVQLIGGGVGSENALLRRQKVPGRFRQSLMHRAARQFDLVVVRGRSALDYLAQIGVGRKAVVIPAGVDTTRFAPRAEACQYDIITVGRLVPVKRYDRLLHMVARLAKSHPQIRCALVGDGSELDRLKKQAQALGIGGNIEFLGRRDDVSDLLGRARLFALTSANEGQSIAMMEAMASGLPVVAPDVGELCDLLIHDETGLVIDADNTEQSAAAIANLLGDEDRRNRMGRSARKRVMDFAAIASVAERWCRALGEPPTNKETTNERDWTVNPNTPTSASVLVGSTSKVD